MTVLVVLATLLSPAFAGKDPCAERSEDQQKAFTGGLETLYGQVSDSQLQPGAKDLSKDAAKQMLAHQKKGELCTAEDRFWAAMNLLQAREQEYADTAYAMAQVLLEERHPRGPWLTGVAYDRMSIAKGALQSYGSQTSVQNGKRCLIWTDLNFSDEKRKQFGHPTLEGTIAKILEINGVTGAKPTVLELKNRDLWCKPEPWDGSRSDLVDPYDGRR